MFFRRSGWRGWGGGRRAIGVAKKIRAVRAQGSSSQKAPAGVASVTRLGSTLTRGLPILCASPTTNSHARWSTIWRPPLQSLSHLPVAFLPRNVQSVEAWLPRSQTIHCVPDSRDTQAMGAPSLCTGLTPRRTRRQRRAPQTCNIQSSKPHHTRTHHTETHAHDNQHSPQLLAERPFSTRRQPALRSGLAARPLR